VTASGWLATGALLGATAVALGAFGAHGLKARVTADLLVVFETAARYHLVHALAIVAVAWAADRFPGSCAAAAGWLFVAGILLFSGSLYLMVLTGARALGAITPLGGLALIAGWIALALAPFLGSRAG
jgi:uncharacterized membrane protein YgdD (TMEM256/DUF423 family)